MRCIGGSDVSGRNEHDNCRPSAEYPRTAALDFANMQESEFAEFRPMQGEPSFEPVGRVAPDGAQKLVQPISE